MKKHHNWGEYFLTLPSFLWLVIFFAVPTLIVFVIAFKPSDPYGGVGSGWTWQTIISVRDPNYPAIIWRTIWISCLATLICLSLAVPVGYYLARLSKGWQNLVLTLIIVPFWTNFLIRIFAWKILLHPEGVVKNWLVALHILPENAILLYNPFAVLLVVIYTYLPFAILPIFAAAEKFDFSLVEAALDLGAGRIKAFTKVFLPGIKRGLLTATLMVFIPALGSYVIPDLVGGPEAEMIGNKIAQRVFIDRNLPHASVLSAVLSLAVLAPMIFVLLFQQRKEQGVLRTEAGL